MLESVYSLVGKIAAASENVIAVTGPAWDHPSAVDQKDIERYIGEFDEAEDAWRTNEEKLSFQMSYYSNGDKSIGQAWQNVRHAVDVYRECASDWHDKAGRFREERLKREKENLPELNTWPWFNVNDICAVQREALTKRMADLGEKLESNRTYVWRGWENPEELRKVLLK